MQASEKSEIQEQENQLSLSVQKKKKKQCCPGRCGYQGIPSVPLSAFQMMLHAFMYLSIFSLMIPLGINYLNEKFSFSQNHKALICQIILPRNCQRMKQFIQVYQLSMNTTDRSCANPSLRITLNFIGPSGGPPVKRTAIVNMP